MALNMMNFFLDLNFDSFVLIPPLVNATHQDSEKSPVPHDALTYKVQLADDFTYTFLSRYQYRTEFYPFLEKFSLSNLHNSDPELLLTKIMRAALGASLFSEWEKNFLAETTSTLPTDSSRKMGRSL